MNGHTEKLIIMCFMRYNVIRCIILIRVISLTCQRNIVLSTVMCHAFLAATFLWNLMRLTRNDMSPTHDRDTGRSTWDLILIFVHVWGKLNIL